MEKTNFLKDNNEIHKNSKDLKYISIGIILTSVISPGLLLTFSLQNLDNIQSYWDLLFIFWILFIIVNIFYLIITIVGLFKGEILVQSITIIVQLVYLITYLIIFITIFIYAFGGINIGAILLLILFISIITSLKKPIFHKYFNKKMFNKTVKSTLLLFAIFIIGFNSIVTCLYVANADYIFETENSRINILTGTWTSEDDQITLKFFKNNSVVMIYKNNEFTGNWKFTFTDDIEVILTKKEGDSYNGFFNCYIDYDKKEITLSFLIGDTYLLKKIS